MISTLLLALALQGSPRVDCERAVTQPDLNECASEEFRRADESLNRQWQITLDVVRGWDREGVSPAAGSTFENRLRLAQRAWVAFRDAECDALYPGTIGAELAYTGNIYCRTHMTMDRARQLAEIARQEPL
jgi:uncharacterized protein YecT (DUF1311 family)